MAGEQESRGGNIIVAAITYTMATIAAIWGKVMQDGTVAAIFREAIKDIRNTNHELWFGRGERFGEPGAPLNLTQGEIAADRKGTVHGYVQPYGERSPSQIADDARGVYGPDRTHEQQHDHEHGHEF